jgi:hypothetical protein
MRRRSNTIYAENLEEYLDTAKVSTSYKCSPFHISRKPPTKKPKEDFDPFGCDLFSDGPKAPVKSKHPVKKVSGPRDNSNEGALEWSDFDFNREDKNGGKMTEDGDMPRTSSITLSENTAAETDESDDDEGFVQGMENSILRRVMVVGLENIGKRQLINNLFDCGAILSEENERIMDLLTKTEEDSEFKIPVRYQFWFRNLKSDEELNQKFEDQVRVYYKNVSLFIFVYSVADKNSYECAERAAMAISQQVQSEKFTAVLLGTDDLKKPRSISYFEGISLQERHHFTFFIETNVKDTSLKEKLVQVMRDCEEGFHEMRNDKLLSISSLD